MRQKARAVVAVGAVYTKTTPKPVNGTLNLERQTASTQMMIEAALRIFDSITDRGMLIRRITITANHVIPENMTQDEHIVQYSFFDDVEALEAKRKKTEDKLKKEKALQQTLVTLKERFGKNAVMKAMNYQESATAIERNGQVGGHRA